MEQIDENVLWIIPVVINIILVFFVILQHQLSIQQYERINRPWLVLTQKGLINEHICWYLENIGNLPVEGTTITTKSEFDKKKPNMEKPVNIGVIMPKQSRAFTLNHVTAYDVEKNDETIIEFTIKYRFLKHAKKSKFQYYRLNPIDHQGIECIEAN